jgi:hypothetical protein
MNNARDDLTTGSSEPFVDLPGCFLNDLRAATGDVDLGSVCCETIGDRWQRVNLLAIYYPVWSSRVKMRIHSQLTSSQASSAAGDDDHLALYAKKVIDLEGCGHCCSDAF